MKLFIEVLAAISIVSAGNIYDGFRAKYSDTAELIDVEYFYQLGRTTSQVAAAGWVAVQRPPGAPLPALTLRCRSDDVTVCLLFDSEGLVAGIQVAVTAASVARVPKDHSRFLLPWKNVTIGNTTQDYWYSNLFFRTSDLSASSTKKIKGSLPRSVSAAEDLTIASSSIWITYPEVEGQLVEIPLQESEISATTHFVKQSCVPNMGVHYFYNVTRTLSCEDYFPWFVLATEGKVIGAGYTGPGSYTQIGSRNWFEPSVQGAISYTVPDGPACLEQWADLYDMEIIHIYFVDEPWTITC